MTEARRPVEKLTSRRLWLTATVILSANVAWFESERLESGDYAFILCASIGAYAATNFRK